MKYGWVIVSAWLIWMTPAVARPLQDLYTVTVTVPVADNAQYKAQGLSKALLTQLERIVGSPIEPPPSEHLQKELEGAEKYANQFSYQYPDRAVLWVGDESMPAAELTVKFDSVLVDRLIQAEQLEPWGLERPVTLMIFPDGKGGFASANTTNRDVVMLREELYRRGVPLVLPLMDTDDVLVIGEVFTGLTKDQWDALRQRYNYEAVLTGRMPVQAALPQPSSLVSTPHIKAENDALIAEAAVDQIPSVTPMLSTKAWVSHWQLMLPTQSQKITVVADSQLAALADISQKVAQHLMQATEVTNKATSITIQVQGISDEEMYNAVTGYLRQMPVIKSLTSDKLAGDAVVYRVRALKGLDSRLAKDDYLVPVTVDNSETGVKHYIVKSLPLY